MDSQPDQPARHDVTVYNRGGRWGAMMLRCSCGETLDDSVRGHPTVAELVERERAHRSAGVAR